MGRDKKKDISQIIPAALLETAAEAGTHRLGKAPMPLPSHSTMPPQISQPALPETAR
ncbi:7673_t:CDS:2 [Funneliformis mosseae]|uniref:7673_t:CDS:1 n=1 Tax=Funneliformis mosseae TaxID=27381 RepID=A0A9N9FX75_FUNMO|nr:7673_t:CDS:2 [Funneliformis mosseae]